MDHWILKSLPIIEVTLHLRVNWILWKVIWWINSNRVPTCIQTQTQRLILLIFLTIINLFLSQTDFLLQIKSNHITLLKKQTDKFFHRVFMRKKQANHVIIITISITKSEIRIQNFLVKANLKKSAQSRKKPQWKKEV